jgi:hypothetical protein
MIFSMLHDIAPFVAVIVVALWAHRRFEQQEARHRLELEHCVMELRRLQGIEPKQLSEPTKPVEPFAQLSVAIVVKR